MRILIVNKFAHVTGGADRHALGIARALREQGHDVRLLSTASEQNLETSGSFVACTVTHESRERLPLSRQADVLRKAIWNPDAAHAMTRLLDDFAPDVVHTHKLYPQLSVAPVVVARRRGVAVVQTLHDYEFISADAYAPDGGRVDRRESRVAYRALNTAAYAVRRRWHVPAVSRWIAVSDFVARTHATMGIHATTIRNFADLDGAVKPRAARDGALFLGTLSKEKGILDVVNVAKRVPDVRFVVAGSGPLASVVARAAETLPNLDFRGRLDSQRAGEAVCSAAVMLIPSRWDEPGALVSLEAMAAGTPIVAYRRGGLGEYVQLSGAGIVVEPDEQRLEDACRSVLDDVATWRRLSDAGTAATTTIFGRGAYVSALLDVYRRAAERAPVSS